MEKISVAKLLEEINDDSRWTEFGNVTIAEHNVGRESAKFLKQLGNLVTKSHENEWESISQSLAIFLLSVMRGDEATIYEYLKSYLSNFKEREKVYNDLFNKEKKGKG